MSPTLDGTGNVQVSADGRTVWVHAGDGSTVGRFSTRFGLDVHTTAVQQLAGQPPCLACTHEPPALADWHRFCDLMQQHYGVEVDRALIGDQTLDGRWSA